MIEKYYDRIIAIEKSIFEIYEELIKRDIYNEDKNKEIEILKILKSKEKDIEYLSYDDLKKILDLSEKDKNINGLIKQRIINIINLIIDKKHLKEELNCSLDDDDDIMDNEDIDLYIKEDTIIKYGIRDLNLLRLNRIEKVIEDMKNCNFHIYKNKLIDYKYKCIYPMLLIEDELIDRNFDLDYFYLLSELAKEISQFDDINIKLIEKQFEMVEFSSFDEILKFNNKDLSDEKNLLKILIIISKLESEFLYSNCKYDIISRCDKFKNEENFLVMERVKFAINKLKNEKSNYNYLTLKRKR